MTGYDFIAERLFPLFTPVKIFQLDKKSELILNLLNLFSDMLPATIIVTEVIIIVFHQTRNRKRTAGT